MRHAASEIDYTAVESGSITDSAPIADVLPLAPAAQARAARRPAPARVRATAVRCQGGSVRPHSRRGSGPVPLTLRAGRPCAGHPEHRVERAQAGLATLAATALITAAVVCGLVLTAQARLGGAPDPMGHTEIVQVRAGESLDDLAARIAPGRPVADTVHRIVELNGLAAGSVAAGRLLVVPAPAR